MDPKKKKYNGLSDILLEDEEMLDYIDWIADMDDDEDSNESIDSEWARAMADLRELGFLEDDE